MASRRQTSSGQRTESIQALRALAALTVALVHLTGGYARFIDPRLAGFPVEKASQLAEAAVALFFMISGCVMVLSSAPLAGSARGTLTFWWRRAVRILPPYWIATGLFVAVLAWSGDSFAWGDVAASAVFWIAPAASGETRPFSLFLWPGWTLFYELVFYALFGACLVLGRGRTVIAASLALVLLVASGAAFSPDNVFTHAVTRPVLLLFIAGMAAGWVVLRGWSLPVWFRWGALAGSVAACALLPGPSADAPLGFAFVAWVGLPAGLLFVAALGGPPGYRIPRPVLVLGDASYAIYLLHIPFAHALMFVFNDRLSHPGGSIGYLVVGVPLLIGVSAVFYRFVERPMTDRLNRLLGGRHRETGLPETLAP